MHSSFCTLHFPISDFQFPISNSPQTSLIRSFSNPAAMNAIGYDAGTRAFLDQFLTAKCLNSNQAGCGDNDTTRNGAGAVRNDGTWTTYELSHPLTGGGVQDISRSAGQSLGFFLTLRVGNGAQGNTQVPGFRRYRSITIAGQ